jgi:acetate kinase
MRVLVVNAGSSTLKLSVVDAGKVSATRTIDPWNGVDAEAVGAFAAEADAIDAVGHRVVHGGTQFTGAVRIDDAVLEELHALVPLAPLHQPRALAAIDAALRVLPAVDHVACFDTAFHASLAPAAYTYALPSAWRTRWPLRRFGFHGLSHAYASRRAAELAGRPLAELRMVTCHLGAGASLCAVDAGRSVDTTMGFTPLEGLVMATRAGSIDPGIVPWLVDSGGLSIDEVSDGLEESSGLVGLCGTADMREVLERRAAGDPEATLAFDVYAHALRRALGAMKAALPALDAVVFTGGVGEHAAEVRAACRLPIDDGANNRTTTDGEVSAPDADPRTFVVSAHEDIEIAAQVGGLTAA